MSKPDAPRGWHSRGYLPHFDGGSQFTQSVTFRLADSLPKHVVERIGQELLSVSEEQRDTERRKKIESVLDSGLGSCCLRDDRIAAVVEAALLFFDGERYRLHSWVVMPNHVHVLFTPIDPHAMSQIVGSWKSFTAKECNSILGRTGQLWEEDYFDRYVRDDKHFHAASDYFEGNPVAAGLCQRPEDWRWGSARRRLAAETAALPGASGGAAGTAADPGANVSATFKIGWKGCELSATVAVPAEPVSPRRLLPMVQQLTNALVGMGENVVRAAGETISCKAGCGACCRQLVPVSETEARHLRDLVEEMPEPRRSEVRARFADTKAKLGEANLLEKLEKPNEHTRDRAIGMDYFRAGIPCPFLEDESCSIHADRPIICREFLVTSPAENCRNPSPETTRKVPIPGFVMTSFARLDGPAKLGVRWVALPLALDWAESHPEPPVAIPGPKHFETFMNALLNGDKVPPPGDFLPAPTEAAP